jgi:hypothetical protein
MTGDGHHLSVQVERPPRYGSAGRRDDLPDDLLQETVQRLTLFCAVGAGTWSVGLLMENVMRPLSVPTAFPWPGNLIAGIMIVALTASFAYVRSRPAADRAGVLDLGLGLLVLNALAIAFLNEWVPTFPDKREVSWNSILILVYAMVVPTAPLKMCVACLVAASMDPMAAGMATLRGVAAPSVANAILLYYPNYICAVIAVLPSVTLRHMGQRITRAHELGSYELVEKLGEGGMGEVWRAEHRLLVRPAAIKLIRPEMLGPAGERDARLMLGQFEREAQATAVLNSPHTIDVFDFGLTRDGAFYYVMELLMGRDLESLIRDFGALPADRVTYLLCQICHSLAEAHARGLVHRDIKPANVYVCQMGLDYDFVKVLDFGLVRFSTRGNGATLFASTSVTTGTPAYMAPEAILGDSRVDTRSDVYSIGCVAYWMLTGQLVFTADSPMKMLMAHVEQAPPPPSHRVELPIPSELEAIVLACLDKNPDQRPQSAQVLWQSLLDCRGRETWTPEMARRWWEGHLPDLMSPQVLAMPAVRPLSSGRV